MLKAWARAALAENYRRAANNGRMFTSACPAFAALPGEKKQPRMASPKLITPPPPPILFAVYSLHVNA